MLLVSFRAELKSFVSTTLYIELKSYCAAARSSRVHWAVRKYKLLRTVLWFSTWPPWHPHVTDRDTLEHDNDDEYGDGGDYIDEQSLI